MTVNSSSTLIGIFTILGLTKRRVGNWDWGRYLKEFRTHVVLILFGSIGAVFMCIHLFDVQAQEIFWGVYPLWMLVWNILFVTASLIMTFLYIRKQTQNQLPAEERETALRQTARLWVFPVLAILFFMHGIVVFVSLSGVNFR